MIALLGLGAMGTPMAHRLLDEGHELTVWNRHPARTQGFAERGAVVATRAAEAVDDADVVILMLADPEAVGEVLDSIIPALPADAVLVDMSSIGPTATRRNAARVPQLVDAPVMGSVEAAAAGQLVIFAGGEVDAVESTLAVLGTVVRTGEVGSGSAMKTVMISAVVAGVALLGESYRLAAAVGVPEESLDAALAASPLKDLYGRANATTADFAVRLAAKDLRLALAEAELPMLAAAQRRLRDEVDQEADLRSVVDADRRART